MRCKREGCTTIIRPTGEDYEKLLQTEWGLKGYCCKDCWISDEYPSICPNDNSIMIYDSSNDEYICSKCDYKVPFRGRKWEKKD